MRLDESYLSDPYPTWRRLRDEAPVESLDLPVDRRVWLVTRYADVRAALANPLLCKDAARLDEIAGRPAGQRSPIRSGGVLGAHMLNTDPPDHDRLRRLVSRAFTVRRIEDLRPRIEQITAGLLDAIDPGGEVDLVDRFAFPLPVTVICELLGMPEADRADFRAWSNVLVSGGHRDTLREAMDSVAAALTALVAAKRADPGDDMLSALVRARDADDRLSENELISMAFLLLVAGHETTANLIGNGVLALLDNPDQQAALRADRSLLPGAIEEMLRYQGPLRQATPRFTVAPTVIGGVEVPAGDVVTLAVGSANRDERRYPGADEFDLRRDPSGHLAFGHGIHFCLGAPLARLEAEIAFAGLLDRFAHIELAVPRDELRWRPGALMRALTSLPVRVGPTG
ncbi:MAG TPA: cytochrome P450 [Pseudonocardiaceae bacterium]|nr:cytochrome P450 [Pseudonocardiaceae bacterium]